MEPTPQSICQYFESTQPTHPVFDILSQTESDICESFKLKDIFDLSVPTSSKDALFGWGETKPDYLQRDIPNLLIEVKYLRCTEFKVSENNECDFKNGLAQIIEQAVTAGKTNAILIVVDAGRARERRLCTIERLFIDMFKNNPFAISLSVIRARINEKDKTVKCEMF